MADWVQALATAAAFLIGALALRADVQVRRQHQARLVYAKVIEINHRGTGDSFKSGVFTGQMGLWAGKVEPRQDQHGETLLEAREPLAIVTVRVHNLSQELLPAARVRLVDRAAPTKWPYSATLGPIEPNESAGAQFVLPNHRHPSQPGIGVVLAFRDASGCWWMRRDSEPIQAVREDPEAVLFGATERRQAAANAQTLGLTPSPAPKIRLAVRWQRLWRKITKQPLL